MSTLADHTTSIEEVTGTLAQVFRQLAINAGQSELQAELAANRASNALLGLIPSQQTSDPDILAEIERVSQENEAFVVPKLPTNKGKGYRFQVGRWRENLGG